MLPSTWAARRRCGQEDGQTARHPCRGLPTGRSPSSAPCRLQFLFKKSFSVSEQGCFVFWFFFTEGKNDVLEELCITQVSPEPWNATPLTLHLLGCCGAEGPSANAPAAATASTRTSEGCAERGPAWAPYPGLGRSY